MHNNHQEIKVVVLKVSEGASLVQEAKIKIGDYNQML